MKKRLLFTIKRKRQWASGIYREHLGIWNKYTGKKGTTGGTRAAACSIIPSQSSAKITGSVTEVDTAVIMNR